MQVPGGRKPSIRPCMPQHWPTMHSVSTGAVVTRGYGDNQPLGDLDLLYRKEFRLGPQTWSKALGYGSDRPRGNLLLSFC